MYFIHIVRTVNTWSWQHISAARANALTFADSTICISEMVKDLLGGRCWITHLDKDTYCRSLRRRLRREVASLDKVRAVRYYQFPQRPDTTCTVLTEDEDQTEVFMYRTNTRLSFRPYISENPRHSRHSNHKLTGTVVLPALFFTTRL